MMGMCSRAVLVTRLVLSQVANFPHASRRENAVPISIPISFSLLTRAFEYFVQFELKQ
jgi:hypothetical protein